MLWEAISDTIPHIIRMLLPLPLPPSPPLPSSAVQLCSHKVLLRESPASSRQALLRCRTGWSISAIRRSCQRLVQKGGGVHVLAAREFREGKSWIIYAFCFPALSEALLILSCLFFSLLWQHLVISSPACLWEGKGNGVFSRKTYHSSQSGLNKLQFKQIKPIGLGYWECCLQPVLLLGKGKSLS